MVAILTGMPSLMRLEGSTSGGAPSPYEMIRKIWVDQQEEPYLCAETVIILEVDGTVLVVFLHVLVNSLDPVREGELQLSQQVI